MLPQKAAHGPHIHVSSPSQLFGRRSQPSDYSPDLGSMCGHQNRSSRATLWHRLIVSQCQSVKICQHYLFFYRIPLHDFTNWICSSKEVLVVLIRYGQQRNKAKEICFVHLCANKELVSTCGTCDSSGWYLTTWISHCARFWSHRKSKTCKMQSRQFAVFNHEQKSIGEEGNPSYDFLSWTGCHRCRMPMTVDFCDSDMEGWIPTIHKSFHHLSLGFSGPKVPKESNRWKERYGPWFERASKKQWCRAEPKKVPQDGHNFQCLASLWLERLALQMRHMDSCFECRYFRSASM